MSVDLYPYGGRDLFADPERYFYARCDQASFFDAWKQARMIVAEALHLRIESQEEWGGTVTVSAKLDGMGIVELLRQAREKLPNRPLAERAIEPLVKKFEVFRRLYSHYGDDYRRTEGAEPVGLDVYLLFAEVLLDFVEQSHSLKHLSCLLKLMDALCSIEPARFSKVEAERCVELIKREAVVVQFLAGKLKVDHAT